MSPEMVAFLITGMISIVIAVFLIHSSRLSAQARIKLDKKRIGGDYSSIKSDSLDQVILDQVKDLVDSEQQRLEISRRISATVNKEFEKRIQVSHQELSKKYETMLQEKDQGEVMVWQKYKKILNDQKKTEAVLHSIAEGLVVVDGGGKVIMMNPAAERLLGVSTKDKIGRPIAENSKEEQLISLVRPRPDQEGQEIEFVSQRDETKKVLRASSAVIEDENGQPVGMVSVLSDITKQKEVDQLKSNFVANVSHELRTPLIAIEKAISLILSKDAGSISEAQEQFLAIAHRNIKRLGLLINDLLDLSKIEAGKMEFKYELFSIEKVINECMAGLNTWAKTKSIQLEKKIHEGIPDVSMDPNRILQVLNNLVGNAIKFTPSNGLITIEAKFQNEREALEVGVTDTGIGIPKEALSKMFDKFYQTGERAPTDISGTGIGLSISKEIVELHNGRIWVESEKGCGAKFTFTLPVRR